MFCVNVEAVEVYGILIRACLGMRPSVKYMLEQHLWTLALKFLYK